MISWSSCWRKRKRYVCFDAWRQSRLRSVHIYQIKHSYPSLKEPNDDLAFDILVDTFSVKPNKTQIGNKIQSNQPPEKTNLTSHSSSFVLEILLTLNGGTVTKM